MHSRDQDPLLLPGTAKTISMGGMPTHFEGGADDPYFLALEENARGLEALGAVVSRHVPRDATVLDIGANFWSLGDHAGAADQESHST
jgi:hypothetical protein